MGKKVSLPVFDESSSSRERAKPAAKPSIDTARARLGGRVTDGDLPIPGFAPGVVVSFAVGDAAAARRLTGVIVFASLTEIHVLLDGIRLRRMAPHELTLHDGEVELDLEKIAADARLFGSLVEGQSVRYADSAGALVDGKVVEKCRWGALVLRDDGAVVAVGFRKLWPSAIGGSA